jgi:hypothetical protein
MTRLQARGALVWKLVLAAIAVLGGIKTIVAAGAGQDVTVQEVAFYFGGAAVFLAVGLLAAIGIGAWLVSILEDVPRGDDVAVVVGIAGGLCLAIYLATTAVWDYDAMTGGARGLVAAIGIAVMTGAVYLWRRAEKQTSAKPQSEGV